MNTEKCSKTVDEHALSENGHDIMFQDTMILVTSHYHVRLYRGAIESYKHLHNFNNK